MIDRKVQVDIQGYDLNPEAVKAARQNAKDAGVDHLIHFQERAVKDLSHPKKYGFIITNPPYGERLEDKKDLPQLYRSPVTRMQNVISEEKQIRTGRYIMVC